jgi:hypothetical protein
LGKVEKKENREADQICGGRKKRGIDGQFNLDQEPSNKMKTKSKSPKTNEEMEVVKSNEKNWDDEARRYIEGVAALLIADSRAGPLLAGTGSGDEVEERVASVLHSLLADRDAWPATARPLRDHILGSLDALTALLITKCATSSLPFSRNSSFIFCKLNLLMMTD